MRSRQTASANIDFLADIRTDKPTETPETPGSKSEPKSSLLNDTPLVRDSRIGEGNKLDPACDQSRVQSQLPPTQQYSSNVTFLAHVQSRKQREGLPNQNPSNASTTTYPRLSPGPPGLHPGYEQQPSANVSFLMNVPSHTWNGGAKSALMMEQQRPQAALANVQFLNNIPALGTTNYGIKPLPRHDTLSATSYTLSGTFVYPPLQDASEGSLRLIRIDPNPYPHSSKEIYCTLISTEPWIQKVPYECLSYCWGGNSKNKNIFIRTSPGPVRVYYPFPVTSNLHDALNRLRDSHRSIWIWIDAISINQKDVHERGLQVAMMREIYNNAAGVVIWLGESTEKISQAVSVIFAIFRYFTSVVGYRAASIIAEGALTLTPEDLDALKRYTSVDVWGITTTQAYSYLTNFFSLPWFRRVWVLQEAFSRTAISVRVGVHSLTWGSVILAALWQSFFTRDYTSRSDIEFGDESGAMRGYLPELWLGLLHDRQPRGLSMLELVLRARDFQATDPRDKVFALLGLANDLPLPQSRTRGLIPDYTKTKEDAYCEFAKEMIQRSGKLDILSAVNKFAPEDDSGEGPSWMPNFDVPIATIRGFGFPKKYNASSSTTASPILLQDVGLRLSGFVVANIQNTTDIVFLRNDLHLYMDNGKDAVHTIWNEYLRPRCHPSSEAEILNSYIHTMTAAGFALPTDFPSHPLGKVVPSSHVSSLIYDFAAYWATKEPTFASFSAALDLPSLSRSGDSDQFAVLAGKACHERRVFFTAGGSVGLCPRDAMPGDSLVILYGGSVPYVLRVREEGGWTFVGEAFVDGLMDGRAMEVQRNEKLKDDIFDIC